MRSHCFRFVRVASGGSGNMALPVYSCALELHIENYIRVFYSAACISFQLQYNKTAITRSLHVIRRITYFYYYPLCWLGIIICYVILSAGWHPSNSIIVCVSSFFSSLSLSLSLVVSQRFMLFDVRMKDTSHGRHHKKVVTSIPQLDCSK